MSNIKAKTNQLNALFLEVQAYKREHPQERIGFYTSSYGSLLNAYREGDLSFDECIEHLKAKESTARAAALESAAKKVDEWAAQYPEDIWPDKMIDDETGEIKPNTHPDAMAAKTLRRILPIIARSIRGLEPPPPDAREAALRLALPILRAVVSDMQFEDRAHPDVLNPAIAARNAIAALLRDAGGEL
jgi:hypothetical protein